MAGSTQRGAVIQKIPNEEHTAYVLRTRKTLGFIPPWETTRREGVRE
jgi:hypothetical protein